MRLNLTRRDFLIAGAGVAAVGTAHAQKPGIIDTHVHFYDPARPQGVPWPARNDSLLYRTVLPPEYSAVAHPFGITGVVIVEASAWLEDNQWILDLASDHPLLAGFVGHLNPGMDDFPQNLARFTKNRLFRGIRVAGADIVKGVGRQAFMDDLQRLADADLSMDVLGNASMVGPLTAIAQKIPTLRLVIDHMPVEPPGWKAEAMHELASHSQVYSKVSTVLRRGVADYKASLDELWDIFGPERVMYGSNWPVSENLGTYSAVFNVVKQYVTGRGTADADKYFYNNSKACYKWIDRT
jgi:predicted TIM-barrel fold metal-dependent hydrolase